jgi:folate-binding protein YgfZ
VPDVIAEYNTFKKSCGIFEQNRGLIKVSGPDAADFLHRLTTQNIKTLTPGTGVPAALLQANAMLISMFDLYHCGNFFLLACDEKHTGPTAEHLEKMHFAEDLKVENISGGFKFISVQGASSRRVVEAALGRAPTDRGEIVGSEEAFIAYISDFEGPGFHVFVKVPNFESVRARLTSNGGAFMSNELWKLLWAQAGRFTFGIDGTERNLILELAAADRVSRNKGCYPGQEVVERVFTYGNVAKKLVGLKFNSKSGSNETVDPAPHVKILGAGKEVGEITSVAKLPWSSEWIAFAMVRRPFYEEGSSVILANGETAEVVSLPHSFEIAKEKATPHSLTST